MLDEQTEWNCPICINKKFNKKALFYIHMVKFHKIRLGKKQGYNRSDK